MSTNTIIPAVDFLSNLPQDANPNVKALAGIMQSMVNILVPHTPNSTGTKKMPEIRPIFRNTAKNLSVFAQVRLLGESGRSISTEEVRELELTDADRYMLHKFSFFVGQNDLKIRIINNIPDCLKGNDLIVAKAITHQSLTREESAIYDSLIKEVSDASYKYNTLRDYANTLIEGKEPYGGEKFFYMQINEARKTGWFDLPEPSADELKYFPKPDQPNQKDIDNAAYSITLNDIEQGLDSAANAGFDFKKAIEFLTGNKMANVRNIIMDGFIDVGRGIIKGAIIDNAEEVGKIFKKIPKIGVDKSVEKIDGLADMIKMILNYMLMMKDADEDKQLDIVDKVIDDIKKRKEVLYDAEFINLLRKVADRCEKNNASGNDEDHKQASATNAAMAMVPADAFPLLNKIMQSDDVDKPSFLTGLVSMAKPPREKPEFIMQTNEVPVTSQETQPQPQVMAKYLINNEVLKAHPWVTTIGECAKKHGITVRIDPVYNRASAEDPMVMTGITFIASAKDFIPSKCFTIDLGYCLDSRIKLFANHKASGFCYMEACNEAYHVFINGTSNINIEFFDKLYLMGFEGFNDDDKKKYRMYNSNTMQLNRWINYITLPTGAVKKGEMRQALKDSAFKMMGILKDITKVNNLNLGRFNVVEFDKENMSYVLDNLGVTFNGKELNAPHLQIRVTIVINNDGKVVKDENNRPKLHYEINFFDNVIAEGFRLPEGTTTITTVPITDNAANPNLNVGDDDDTEAVEVIEAEVVTDDEKPEFLKA